MTNTRRLSLAYLALTAGVAVLFALNLFWGSVSLTPGAVAAALLGRGEDALAVGIVLQLRLPRAVMVVLLGRDHGRGGRRDLAAVGVANEGDGHLRRVANLLNEALLIGGVVKHILHLRDERLTGIVVGDQAEQTADLRHVTLSVNRWSPPRGSIAS